METIRLYPFFTAFTAEAAQDTNIEDLAVPAGTQLCMPLWAIGRQTSLWGPDAAVFRPERWIESANGGASSPLAFMSFMHGPRQCPGKEYAITNSMALLSSMVRGFEWEKVDGRQGCVGCGFLLSPKGGMQLRMSAVEKC
jgi:cytochrome P450